MNKKHFSLLGLIGFIVFDIITSVALACTPTYKQGYLQIPAVEKSEFSWVLKKISEKPLKFSITEQPMTEQDANCEPTNYDEGFLDIPAIEAQDNAGNTLANYSAILKVDPLTQTATALYYQRIDAVNANAIKIDGKTLPSVTLMKGIANYFGDSDTTLITAYNLSNIAILVSKTDYFVVSKKIWMSPVLVFAKGNPVENKKVLDNLVAFDKSIQQKMTENKLPTDDVRQRNKKKWDTVFALAKATQNSGVMQIPSSAANSEKTCQMPDITGVVEQKCVELSLWELSQSNRVNGVFINKYTPELFDQKTQTLKHAPVGCTHLAIARIMNWYKFPKGDVFFTGDQYALNPNKVTDSFASLVADIGRAANSKYDLNGTSMSSHEIVPLFQLADYSAVELASGTIKDILSLSLYSSVKEEINAQRPSLLQMWWDNFKLNPDGTYKYKDHRVGHAVVVTGYRELNPLGIEWSDLYLQVAMGWGGIDYAYIQLDDPAIGGFLWTITPRIPGIKNDGNFEYRLFGKIFPKKTKFELAVQENPFGNVVSEAPYSKTINCGNGGTNCTANFHIQSIVKLTAAPKAGYKFANWSGACSGNAQPCIVIMVDSAKTIAANFEPMPQTGYSKIANDGSFLPDTAVLGTNAKDWACTRDNAKGLMWEVKTNDGGLHDMHGKYIWSDWYASTVNSQTLCGYNDWRMPTLTELQSLVNTAYRPTIDPVFFPNTLTEAIYWSSISHPYLSSQAWGIAFNNGASTALYKGSGQYIRLVRTNID